MVQDYLGHQKEHLTLHISNVSLSFVSPHLHLSVIEIFLEFIIFQVSK